MKTTHRLHIEDARNMSVLADASIQLVVTSPPYPMIEMWDEAFTSMNPEVGKALEAEEGLRAFELMHLELDRVWAECFRVVSPGGFACINIGDATRTVKGDFRLYHNHARILAGMVASGFNVLPDILWRKPTNAPNKFMGSGMLPAGAYVTYEHEYILVFRKGGKRIFTSKSDREQRSRSAFFWEERNRWFSDMWMDLRGIKQKISKPRDRERSAAFPFELPYRLINMYSVYGDTVLDPFVGTGTTMAAAVTAARSSVGVEFAGGFSSLVDDSIRAAALTTTRTVQNRLEAHRNFVEARIASGKTVKHENERYGFPVMTRQERIMELMTTTELKGVAPGQYEAVHALVDEHSVPVEFTGIGRQAEAGQQLRLV